MLHSVTKAYVAARDNAGQDSAKSGGKVSPNIMAEIIEEKVEKYTKANPGIPLDRPSKEAV